MLRIHIDDFSLEQLCFAIAFKGAAIVEREEVFDAQLERTMPVEKINRSHLIKIPCRHRLSPGLSHLAKDARAQPSWSLPKLKILN